MARPPQDKMLLGLLGSGIQRSRSPILYEREGNAQGVPCFYQLIDLEALGLGSTEIPELLTAAERMGFAGLNVTHPCKQTVIPHLTDIDDGAREIGAVNTVLLQDGKRIGYNTDWIGFLNSFKRGLPDAAIARAVQFGAGGAGAATAYALLKMGVACVTIIEPDEAKAKGLMERLNGIFGSGRVCLSCDTATSILNADGIVHATPIGMYGHPGVAVPRELFRNSLWIAEVVYFPRETALLRMAAEAGCRTLDGVGMVIHQAAAAFQLFFNKTPDIERMYRHFETYSEARE